VPEQVTYTLPETPALPAAPQVEGTYVYSPDHAERMVSKLIEFFRKPRASAVLRDVFGPQVQEIEDTLWELFQAFDLDTATGATLDFLGAIVGELRNDRDDDEYRVAVKLRLMVNRSEGTVEELLAILVLADPDLVFTLREYWPASIILRWTGAFTRLAAPDLFVLMQQAKPAGVLMHAIISDPIRGFRWGAVADAGQTTDRAFSTIAGGDGGLLQQVLG
jgi:hypothetical protein